VPEFIDTHAHTNFDVFDEDRDEVYRRAREAGISILIEVGVGLEGSRAALTRATAEPMVRAAAGLHPTGLAEFETEWPAFEDLVRSNDLAAVGECGLDYYWMKSPEAIQAEAFRRQIHLARQMSLPFIVHCRDAEEDLIKILAEESYGRGVVHCFGGTADQARRILDLGLHISFCGNVTYKKNVQAQDAARVVPLDRLLLETDSPFLAPQGRRGKRNEPAHMIETARYLADLKGVALEELAQTTTRNARVLFDLKPDAPGVIAYQIGDNLYINLTRLCTAHCEFCPREGSDRVAWGHDLALERDPTSDEILEAVAAKGGKYDEIVYCGLGEPMIRLANLLETARHFKAQGRRIRINTNGHGNLIHGHDITPQLAGLVDSVSISLNAQDAGSYDRICPSTFGARAFDGVLEFARRCGDHVPDVAFTVVEGAPGVDVEACRALARACGVRLRTRPLDDLQENRNPDLAEGDPA